MVEEGRNGAVFARVMCLASPQEPGDAIAADARPPLAAADRHRVAGLVRGGAASGSGSARASAWSAAASADSSLGWRGERTSLGPLTEHGGAEPAE